MKGVDYMKIYRLLALTGVVVSIVSSNVFASSKTDAYNKLDRLITEVDPKKEGINYYVATDKNKNDWHGVYDDKGNIVAMTSTVYDRGEAEDIAGEFGSREYYKVPMGYRNGLDFYQIIIPVYKDTEIDILCARPTELYDGGYKVIKEWDMSDNDVIILRTNLTPSYMVRVSNGDNDGFVKWDSTWYPEEENN